MPPSSRHWVDDIVEALLQLGGEASYAELYPVLAQIRVGPLTPSWNATVRRIIEDHSRDSANFRGVHLFDNVGRGRWRLSRVTASGHTQTTQQHPEETMQVELSGYEEFRETWLESVKAGSPSTTQLGHRFAEKLLAYWLDIDESQLDITYCDGAGDGGIDAAVLEIGAADSEDEDAVAGDVWYLVQSKYGAAFAGTSTLLVEGQKVIETLDGRRSNLSSLASGLLERLGSFRKAASHQDRIVLTFATVDPLDEGEQRALEDLRAMGRARLGVIFDVTAISLRTIYERIADETDMLARRRLTVPLSGSLKDAGDDLLVGAVSLVDLYTFLKDYRSRTNDLDQLFEKNVRRFLGGKVRVNKGMQATLRDNPERFGLFNNGITVVVSDYAKNADGSYALVEPYVVNGCQTTRTIWEVCYSRFDSGGTGRSDELDAWRARAKHGCVVTKVAKVGDQGEELLQQITRYTNSQNAVRDKDFIALSGDFRTWHAQLAQKYDLYLEIQRGGWESQVALQRQRPGTHAFKEHANATELMKVYGAGWLGEAGVAFGKVPPFLPNGSVFKRIMDQGATGERPFGADDLYAAYLLQQSAQRQGFGRGGSATRRQSKFLYYLGLISLLRDVLQRTNMPAGSAALTAAVLNIFRSDDTSARDELESNAGEFVDTYLTPGEDSVFEEPAYKSENGFNFDLNAFLKWERLGKNQEATPRLFECLGQQKRFMGKSQGQRPTPRQIIMEALSPQPV